MPTLLDLNVGLAKDNEQVAGSRALQFPGHVQVGIHARLQDRDAGDTVEFGRAGVEIERAGDHHVEAGVGRLAGGIDEVRPRDDAEFRTDQDRRAALSRAR